MSTEANKAIAQRWLESLNRKELDVADELLAADFVSYMPGLPTPIRGAQAFKQFTSILWSALPDFHHTVEEVTAEGDKVEIRWNAHATHTGTFMGIPPTGKQVTVTGTNTYRIASGKIVEQRSDYDQWGLMQQLGVFPTMGQSERGNTEKRN
jgi:steroid delta-isomerase-like uncharacterized protein